MENEGRYYPDTSIFIDIFENRGRNGEKALKLFEKIIQENSMVLFSDLHIKEFKNFGYIFREVIEMLSFVKRNLRKVHIYRGEKELAKKISIQRNVPRGDVLHAILVRNNEAQLISRDEHFEKLRDIAIAKKPEELT